jgi:16S rRNA C1402 (ribose-2'-O) methylase RsmI
MLIQKEITDFKCGIASGKIATLSVQFKTNEDKTEWIFILSNKNQRDEWINLINDVMLKDEQQEE